MREDLERDLQALVTDSTLRQAESVAFILHDVAVDRRGRALRAAAWNRSFVCARAGPVPGHLEFAPPAIADTCIARPRAGPTLGAPACVRRAGAINRVLKGGLIIVTTSVPIVRTVA
jgi:hypothetical protein